MSGRPPEESASSPTQTQQPEPTGAAISPIAASSNNSTKLSPLPHAIRHGHEVLPPKAVASPLNTVKATHPVPKQSLIGSSPAMKTGSVNSVRSSMALGAYSTETNGDASGITISQCMRGSGLQQDSGIAHCIIASIRPPCDSFLPLYLFELYALQFVCFPLCSYSNLSKRTPSLCSAPSQPCSSHAGTPELWWWWGGAYSFGPSGDISGHLWPVELRPESGSCGFFVSAEFGSTSP